MGTLERADLLRDTLMEWRQHKDPPTPVMIEMLHGAAVQLCADLDELDTAQEAPPKVEAVPEPQPEAKKEPRCYECESAASLEQSVYGQCVACERKEKIHAAHEVKREYVIAFVQGELAGGGLMGSTPAGSAELRWDLAEALYAEDQKRLAAAQGDGAQD